MPGRLASAASRGERATASAKSTTTSRRTTRNSSPTSDIPDEGADSSLRRAICTVFADAQKSIAGHRKAIISLRKIQEACCYEPVSQNKDKRTEEFDEDDFNGEVVRCILRILPVKKAEPVGDRVIRFLGTYLNVATTKDNELVPQDDDPNATSLPETPTSRLTSQVLTTLLPLLQAKEKTIRFRATQITSHIINSLDTLDDTLFHQLRHALLRRIHDKEAPVRLQAVYGLGRLAAEVDENEEKDDSDSDDEAAGVLQKLLVVLQHDPSAEVRRNLLLNLPLTKDVLPFLLERARDADASTRRALYARLLPALGDFRHLGLTHREKVLRWGLRDRDDNVRKATAKLFFERWIEDCAALPAAQAAEQAEHGADDEQAGQKPQSSLAPPSLDALLELLERIDVVNSGIEGGIALTAMEEFWQGRPDYFQYVSFPDSFWEDLSPELSFVARTFNAHCKATSHDAVIEEKLPEVTKFGFLLEREINRLLHLAQQAATQEADDDLEEELAHREFVVEQMLHMALTFDYSDEVGRRKMSILMRESLAKPDLPEEVTRLVVDNLRLTCGEDAEGENHFCSIVVEVLAEVHDTILGEQEEGDPDSTSMEESFHSATTHFEGAEDDTIAIAQKMSKKQKRKGKDGSEAAEPDEETKIREIMVNMKCLHIALSMLQNVQCDLVENVHLVTMLNNLIVPAVRSQSIPIRERGLVCLGLCCLLGKNLARENLGVFFRCFTKGHAEMQVIALQIIADIIIAHPSLLAESPPTDATVDSVEATPSELCKQILKSFRSALKSPDMAVQSTGAIALSKAMLSRLITDPSLLQQLVIAYFDPDTATNAQLRQSLTYFLPVYCHSGAENAARMTGTTCGIINKLFTLRDTFEDEDVEGEAAGSGEGMVKINQVGNILLDWTDPRKIVGASDENQHRTSGGEETHLLLAERILERLVTTNISNKDEKKVLLSMLGKLYIPTTCSTERLTAALELLTEAIETKVAVDKSSTDTLKRLQVSLLNLVRDAVTAERGGDETVLEPTIHATAGHNVAQDELPQDESGADEDEEDSDVTQLQREMGDATLNVTEGFLTTGLPDAEGTRIQLGVLGAEEDDEEEDTEMMDVDDQ